MYYALEPLQVQSSSGAARTIAELKTHTHLHTYNMHILLLLHYCMWLELPDTEYTTAHTDLGVYKLPKWYEYRTTARMVCLAMMHHVIHSICDAHIQPLWLQHTRLPRVTRVCTPMVHAGYEKDQQMKGERL